MVAPPTLAINTVMAQNPYFTFLNSFLKPPADGASYYEIWFLKNYLSKTTKQNSEILHINSIWVCVIEICSNGGAP